MKRFRAPVLAMLSASLLSLSLPNELYSWGNPALGLIALTPLFIAFTMTSSYKEAFIVGALFGGLAHGLSSYWLWFFNDFRFWTLGTSSIAYMIVYGFLGLYLRGVTSRTGLARPLVFALAWVVFEWGKSSGFLGYPWGLVAYSWNTVLPVVQIAESTGVYGISLVLAWFSAATGELLTQPPSALQIGSAERSPTGRLRSVLPARPQTDTGRLLLAGGQIVTAVVLLIALTGYGSVALRRPRVQRGMFTAVLVQQNIDPWEGTEAGNLATSIRLAREAMQGKSTAPDLIVFSETTLRRPWKGFERFFAATPRGDPLAGLLSETGSWLFTGAPEILDYETWEATNSVILIDPDGVQRGSYAKIHPVPFAEAIPFWDFDPFREFIQNVVGLESGWVMGSERTLFTLPTKTAGNVVFAGPICFEDAFAYLCREFVLDGAELLINLTNDSWSKTRSAEIQHFVAARFRAIELRRTLVRSTNGGVSAVVGPDGRVLESLPLFEEASAWVDIPVYVDEQTPYLAYGDWFVMAAACFLMAIAIILYVDDALSKKERP
ncbi:MAG: apolipoprotein N-acyltransferase [Spirochaetales bacterium]|nr:apolipoprotein N-acyltransferase [Spirochaetales bacterium]